MSRNIPPTLIMHMTTKEMISCSYKFHIQMRLQYCHFCDAGDQVLVGGRSISRGKTVFRTNESMRLQPCFYDCSKTVFQFVSSALAVHKGEEENLKSTFRHSRLKLEKYKALYQQAADRTEKNVNNFDFHLIHEFGCEYSTVIL
jgi:hypothetical protein